MLSKAVVKGHEIWHVETLAYLLHTLINFIGLTSLTSLLRTGFGLES
jgi:hypothetical protein